MTRREMLSAVSAVAISSRLPAAGVAEPGASAFEKRLVALEKASGGRLGVAVLDTANGALTGHRLDERFPMCSTFKMLAAGAVLARVDQRKEDMARIVHFQKEEVLPYSPATGPRAGTTGMSMKELCAAAVTLSDNTAANLLLASLGGPAGLTAFVRTLGDGMTRLDRIEPDLNESLPGDPRDTTTPASIVKTMRALLLNGALSKTSTIQLTDWLIHNETGDKRLRAGVPATWKVGDKTGTGPRGTANDLAILWPPGQAPAPVAVFLTGAAVDADQRERTIAEVGKEIAAVLRH